MVYFSYPTTSLAVHESQDVILVRSFAYPNLSDWRMFAIESGVASAPLPGVVSGLPHVGSNMLDAVTILVVMDGVLGYIAGVPGTFSALESGGQAVAVTDNYLFWNGAAGCTGYSTTLGVFELGPLSGASTLTGSTCRAAIEHGGKLYLTLDDSGVVARFDVVQQAPALGPVGLGVLVCVLAAVAIGVGKRSTIPEAS